MSEHIVNDDKVWNEFLMSGVIKRLGKIDDPAKSLSADLNNVKRLRIIRISNGTIMLGFKPVVVEKQNYEKNVERINKVHIDDMSKACAELLGEEYRIEVLPVEIHE